MPRGQTLKIEGHDNRTFPEDRVGKDAYRKDTGFPIGFGYVYFTDGTRVGWSDDKGAWPCRTSWGETTRKHINMANEYLLEQGLVPGPETGLVGMGKSITALPSSGEGQ
jgi:hypothetical protein